MSPMTLRDMLGRAPAAHRRAVAASLGLRDDGAEELAAALLQADRLRAICDALDGPARAVAAHAALYGGEIALRGYGPRAEPGPGGELERYGIAFMFEAGWHRAYRIPEDLRRPLAAALAARHADKIAGKRAARWVGAPQQHLHDAAAVAAFCARTPIRVKADGQVYARAWPKLIAALPELELDAGDAQMRVIDALELLRDHGFVRLSVDDRPGAEARRELVPAGDLHRWLATAAGAPDAGPAADPLLAATVALTDVLAGRDVALAGFAAALIALLREAGIGLHARWTQVALAVHALGTPWRSGALQLGVSRDAKPVAARMSPVAPAAAAGALGVCQSNFEIVALRPPTPSERLVLCLCCEAVAGQAHVWRLTRSSARCGQRCGLDGGVAAALARMCSGELPQNVVRCIEDWVRDVRAPLRLRSAIMIDAGDPETAERLLGGPLAELVVERLGASLLAVAASRLRQVEEALSAAGEQLEAGLDRVSGRWMESPSRSQEALAAWTPARAEEHEPSHKLVSTLRADDASAAPAHGARVAGPKAPLAADPIAVVVAALERQADVFMVYTGARGTTERVITPIGVDGGRVRAYCHLREDERSFWLSSIQMAEEVG